MRIFSFHRALLREAIVPLLCALMALWGIAQARTQASFVADPAHLTHLALCTTTPSSGTDDAPEHDCGACCLPGAGGVTGLPQAHPALQPRLLATLLPHGRDTAVHPRAIVLPWSRGPPGLA